MSDCPHCHRPVAGRGDFCDHCGAYLRWAPSGEVRLVRPAAAAKDERPPASATRMQRIRRRDLRDTAQRQRPAAPAPGGDVRLTLRPAGERGRADRLAPRVVPGESVSVIARVHNRTDRVDHFTVSVSGLPDGWWTVTPATVFLNPYGSRGRHEQDVEIRLHPPRVSGAEARPWPLTVSVDSQDRRAEVASATLVLDIAPYEELTAELRPNRRAGRRRGRYSVAVVNGANAPVEVALAARDEEDACRMAFSRTPVTVGPGEVVAAGLTVRPLGHHWIGRPVEHRLEIDCRPTAAAREPVRLPGVFVRKPWLPWWLPIAAAFAVAAAVAALALIPHTTRVPDLIGAPGPFAAQQRLTAAKLVLAPSPQRQVAPRSLPGTILRQDPAPGQKAKQGSAVTVVVATGTGRTTVPQIAGMKPADADALLRSKGLTLGTVQPQSADLGRPIAVQVPAAGQQVKTGSTVNVSVAAATPADRLGALHGSKPSPSPTPTPTPSATATATPPAQGGATPPFAFDDGRRLMQFDGTAGPLGGIVGTEPDWAPDGHALAYMTGGPGGRGRIEQVDPARGAASARLLTDGRGDYHRPAYSPQGGLLAYIDKSGGRGRLCLQPADGRRHHARCLRAPGWSFDRRPAWSPDGSMILVVAESTGSGHQTGLYGFRATDGPSARPGAWSPLAQGLVAVLPRANAVDWSPDGRTVAAIGDADGLGTHVYLLAAGANGVHGRPRSLPTQGCELAWTPDGRLAVSQYACAAPRAAAGAIAIVDPAQPTSAQLVPGAVGADPAFKPKGGT